MEDEWDRDPEAMELEDLLFVAFDTRVLTSDQILETVKKEGFEAQIRSSSSQQTETDTGETSQ